MKANKKGVTLIELIIVMVVIAIAGALIMTNAGLQVTFSWIEDSIIQNGSIYYTAPTDTHNGKLASPYRSDLASCVGYRIK